MCFPLYVLAPGLVELALALALISALMTVYGVIQFSYRMRLIPDELQGRVNSVYRLLLFAGDPLGLALTGALLQVSGWRRRYGSVAPAWLCWRC